MILVIVIHECRRLFLSPLAWSLLAVTQGLLAWIFVLLVDDFRNSQGRLAALDNAPGVTDLVAAPLFRVAAWVLLLLVPLLTMRLFSQERRSRTLDLLLSAPVGIPIIVLGKYLGVMTFFLSAIGLVTLMPLSLAIGAPLDLGKLWAGALGLTLLTAAATAAGVYLSTLTTQPAVAAVTTLGLLLALWIVGVASAAQGISGDLLSYLSLRRHYDSFLLGLFDSSDLVYYLLFSLMFLGLAMRRLDDLRLRD
ncbi:MAG: ABC transporter permease subunit [Candidatus Competibacteraceae bacterium]|nr:ABC transporter permease subunit [Candidatus Competibacteraceae bacterium]